MATSIDSRTADMMIARLQAELDDLFAQQEADKPKQRTLKAPSGLLVPPNLLDTIKLGLSGGVPKPIKLKDSNIDTTTLADVETTEVPNKGGDFFFNRKWSPNYWSAGDKAGDLFNGIAQLSPVIANIATGFQKTDKLDPRDYYNPYRNQVASLMANRRVNVNPQLDAILDSERTGYYNLRNIGPTNFQSNMAAIANQAMKNRAGVLANKQNMDLGYMGEQAQMLQNEGMHQAGVNYQVDKDNLMTDANRRNIFREGLSQLSQKAQLNKLNKNRLAMDPIRIQALEDMFGPIAQYMQSLQMVKNI